MSANVANLIYFVTFFHERYKYKYLNRSQQILPPVSMGLAALTSLICFIDCTRRFIQAKLRRKNGGGDDNDDIQYAPLDLASSDSDSD